MRKVWVVCLVVLLFPSLSYADSRDINIYHSGFDEETLTLSKGDSITFINSDDVAHDLVVSDSQKTEDKGFQKPGDRMTVKFDDLGTYKVQCALVPRLKMDVVVQ